MARRGRARTSERPGPAGFLVVRKPSGWTSHDAVNAARQWLGTRRVGHLGTLDPLATGVLPLAVREATKLAPYLASEKSYVGSIRLGEVTDTLDAEGRVLERRDGPFPDHDALAAALCEFEGEIEQIPPMYSAVKQKGVPLHRLARRGEEVERAPKKIRIERLVLRGYRPPDLDVDVDCSAGTYVRVLAADLGERLGCGAHLLSLERTRSGPFKSDQSHTPEDLSAAAERGEIDALVLPAALAVPFAVVRLTPDQIRRVVHGNEIAVGGDALPPGATGRIAAIDTQGELVAVMDALPGRRLKPLRVLRSLAPEG